MGKLRAIVIGAGWAGEGHVIALRDVGVEVVALCGRTAQPVRERAQQLGVPEIRLGWRAALAEFEPDMVTIATPGDTHCEMALAAAEQGLHILCEKPLGINAGEARSMLNAVRQAGVKHAYGATGQYDPALGYARQLIAAGKIGQIWQVEYVHHTLFSTKVPYNWFHELSLGGGFLNSLFTHHLGEVTYVTGGKVIAATGMVTRKHGPAPVTVPVHDIRQAYSTEIAEDQISEWRASDADIACTVIVQLDMPDGSQPTALFQGSGQSIGKNASYGAFFGTQGTLRIDFQDVNKILLATSEQPDWQELSLPPALINQFPAVKDPVQRRWNQLAREFVDHIQGQSQSGYPTFYDGWIANEVIDSVRSFHGWVPIPAEPI